MIMAIGAIWCGASVAAAAVFGLTAKGLKTFDRNQF